MHVGFFYFLPGVDLAGVQSGGVIDRGVIEQLGLQRAFRDVLTTGGDCVAGNVAMDAGVSGVMIYPKPPGHESVAAPKSHQLHDSQEWRKIGSGDYQYWIGWERDRPPNCHALARKTQRHDYLVADDHGNEWLILSARSKDGGYGGLDVTYGYDRDLQPCKTLAAADESLWHLAGEVWDDFKTGCTLRDDNWRALAAVQILSINYRIGRAEIYALQECGRAFLDQRRVLAILRCFLDDHLPEELTKKKSLTGTSETSDRTEE